MAQFSRRTILAATDLMANWGHTDINRMLLGHTLEETIPGGSRVTGRMRSDGISSTIQMR